MALVRAFITHKQSEQYADCQDSYSISAKCASIALADGMTQSMLPKVWADMLTHRFACDPTFSLKDDASVDELRHQWKGYFKQELDRQIAENNPTAWIMENQYHANQSAGSTFVGIRIRGTTVNYEILGDSCLILIRNGGIREMLSSLSVDDKLSSFTDYVDSNPMRRGQGIARRGSFEFGPGDDLLLVTDAVFSMISSALKHNNEQNIIQELTHIRDYNHFCQWIEYYREKHLLPNDDSTVVHVKWTEQTELILSDQCYNICDGKLITYQGACDDQDRSCAPASIDHSPEKSINHTQDESEASSVAASTPPHAPQGSAQKQERSRHDSEPTQNAKRLIEGFDKAITIHGAIRDRILDSGVYFFQKDSKVPFSRCGSSSIVYPYKVENAECYAIRCSHTPINDAQARYNIISQQIRLLKLPYFVECDYVANGIMTDALHPIVRMTWVNPPNLKNFILKNHTNKKLLATLLENFLQMQCKLHSLNISHGDLQYDNIRVNDQGEIVLVDYDSMYMDELASFPNEITGNPAFQHSSRIATPYPSPKADYFSELVIYTVISLAIESPPVSELQQLEPIFDPLELNKASGCANYKQIIQGSSKLSFLIDQLRAATEVAHFEDLHALEKILLGRTHTTT